MGKNGYIIDNCLNHTMEILIIIKKQPNKQTKKTHWIEDQIQKKLKQM